VAQPWFGFFFMTQLWVKMLGECGDVQKVQSNGSSGVVAPLSF